MFHVDENVSTLNMAFFTLWTRSWLTNTEYISNFSSQKNIYLNTQPTNEIFRQVNDYREFYTSHNYKQCSLLICIKP